MAISTATTVELSSNSLSSEGLDFGGSEKRGPILRVKPKQLAEEGTTGELFIGRYLGEAPNSLNPDSPDYKFRGGNDSLIFLSSCGSIKRQMKDVKAGDIVRVSYEGQGVIKKGPMKGKKVHNFTIETAASSADVDSDVEGEIED